MYFTDLGLMEYKNCLDLQYKLLDLKRKDFPDVLLIVEHPSVITLGKRGKESNILISENELKRRGIEKYYIERGGDITYHGPGQMVGYPMIRLKNYKLKVKDYIEKLEEVIIQTLKNYSIESVRDSRNHGVWVGNNKIASIGISLKHWISFHGFALNVNTDLEEFSLIRLCGLSGVGPVSMKKIEGTEFPLKEVSSVLVQKFSHIFNIALKELSYKELLERINFFENNKT